MAKLILAHLVGDLCQLSSENGDRSIPQVKMGGGQDTTAHWRAYVQQRSVVCISNLETLSR